MRLAITILLFIWEKVFVHAILVVCAFPFVAISILTILLPFSNGVTIAGFVAEPAWLTASLAIDATLLRALPGGWKIVMPCGSVLLAVGCCYVWWQFVKDNFFLRVFEGEA